MASLFKDPNKLSAYRDRRFQGTQEEYEHALQTSITVYIGNLSFYTTEEQVYELFSRAGEIKKIIMGLDKNSKTPCGFCFVRDEYRTDYDPDILIVNMVFVKGGYGKLVQRELEAQRQLVEYGGGSLDSFQPNIPTHYGRRGGDRLSTGYRQSRDYSHKRYRDEERTNDYDSRDSDNNSRLAKNPRFRESGDSDEEDDDGQKRRR
ncbi:hypothetical protein KFK09_027413 [Dendrobium nobile]|uniref:Nuclear cap-binding protein subunit 2 n=1 Tax=Dendrobium nobile TaxID=94219 RepID=A0A8T3A9M4_DENNO|nr:hypothetical protein KFK09_027413 [Dendrobium nobile]